MGSNKSNNHDVVCGTVFVFSVGIGFDHTKIWSKMPQYITLGPLLSHKSPRTKLKFPGFFRPLSNKMIPEDKN